jgi:hypothetical protein
MKKLGALSLVLLLVAGALAADDGLAVSGDLKTGLIFEKNGDEDLTAYVGHNDDAGNPGRVRLNFAYTKGNLELKWRVQYSEQVGDAFAAKLRNDDVNWADNLLKYAFGTVSFLDKQVNISLGRIDGNLWAVDDPLWVGYDAVSGARFEFKPAVVEGLSFGFALPASAGADTNGDWTNKLKSGDFFSELAFGLKYAPADLVDLRFSVKLDSDADYKYNADNTSWVPNDEGTKMLWSVSPTLLEGIVPGLKVLVNGDVQGIGVNDALATRNTLRVDYALGDLSTFLRVRLDTSAKSDPKTEAKFYLQPAVSYKVFPWLMPGIEGTVQFYFYDSGAVYGTKEANAFDLLEIKPYVEFDLGGGFTVKPYYNLAYKAPNAPSSDGDDSKTDHNFGIRFTYGF